MELQNKLTGCRLPICASHDSVDLQIAMESAKNFSLMVFDRKDFLLYYDVTEAHLDLWTRGAGTAVAGADTKDRLGNLFLPMLAANKSMRCSLGNGITGITGKKFTLVTKKCFGCTLILCGQTSLLDLSHILYQSVKFLSIIFGPDLGHALSLKEPSSLSLFSHLLHFWNRLRSSDLSVLFQVPEQHADLSDDVEMRLTETMTKSTVGRLNKEKCTTVVHFFENCILQSKDACYINPDEMWLFYLLARTFDQSQTLWLHLTTNSRSATRRPFVVQQIYPGNGFTTFIVTPVIGVEKLCSKVYEVTQTLDDLIETGVPTSLGGEDRSDFEHRTTELVETCMSMKCVQLVRHVWAVKHFVSASKGQAMASLRGEMLLSQLLDQVLNAFRSRCLPPTDGVQDLITRAAHLTLLQTYSKNWRRTLSEVKAKWATAATVRKIQSENLTRHLLAQANAELGSLYIDGRKNVITGLHSRPDPKSTAGIGSGIVKLISSASHDIRRTETLWSQETVSVAWTFGDDVGEGCEAKKATLVSWFEDEKGRQLELDASKAVEVWSACKSCYGTKCQQFWMSKIFATPYVAQNRILCISSK